MADTKPLPRGEWESIATFLRQNNGGLRALVAKFDNHPQHKAMTSFVASYRPRRCSRRRPRRARTSASTCTCTIAATTISTSSTSSTTSAARWYFLWLM